MGTKLQYAFNLLEPSPNSTKFLSVHCVNELDYSQTRELNLSFQIPELDKRHSLVYRKMPEKYNLGFIRKTIQMHEDTFKHQVRELHRLYSVQKMLMDELKKEIKQNKKYWSSRETSCSYSLNFQGLRDDDPSPRERSSSCSGEIMGMTTKGFDLERPAAEEDISPAISTAIDDTRAAGTSCLIPMKRTNKMSMNGSDYESEVELTLSIGGSSTSSSISSSKKLIISANQEMGFAEHIHKPLKEHDSPASIKYDRGEDCSTPTTPMSSSSATFNHERKQPHWLFQGLSINRTS